MERRSFIDPHTYENPYEAVRRSAQEIESSLIAFEDTIGHGNFGEVCRGKCGVSDPDNGIELTGSVRGAETSPKLGGVRSE